MPELRTALFLATLSALAAAKDLRAQCQNEWLPLSGCPGAFGEVTDIATWDPDGAGPAPAVTVFAGQFLTAGDQRCPQGLAFRDPVSGTWSTPPALPLPVAVSVAHASAIEVMPSGRLAVAFTPSSGALHASSRVATFDGTTWTVLGGDFDGSVRDLQVLTGGALIAGGSFGTIGGSPAAGLAEWTGTAWQQVGNDPLGAVEAIVQMPNGDIAVGGSFATIGSVPVNNVARFDGVQWSAFGTGSTIQVVALVSVPGGDLYSGSRQGLRRWDGTSWNAVPGLGSTRSSLTVSALAMRSSTQLVVAGIFDTVSGQASNCVGQLDLTTNTWTTFGTGLDDNARPQCVAFTPGGDMIVGGRIIKAGGLQVVGAARHDGAAWHALHEGVGGSVACGLALDDVQFVVAGNFRSIGDAPFASVARWDGAAWQPLGAGIPTPTPGDTVSDLVRMPNGDIVACGQFALAGGAGIARWDGASWSTLGGGLQYFTSDGNAARMELLANGDLVVVGGFTHAGDVPANNVAVWDGASWSALGTGLVSNYGAIDVDVRPNGNLLVLGAVNEAIEWNGATWSTVATFASTDALHCILALDDLSFVVGGAQTRFFGRDRYAFAQVVSQTLFSPRVVSSTSRSWVSALRRLPDGDVLVAGSFLDYGGVPAHGMVRLSGPQLGNVDTSLGGGYVTQFEPFPGGDLLAVGSFLLLGDVPAYGIARLSTTCPASAIASGTGCVGSSGPAALTATSLPWLGANYSARSTGMPNAGLAVALLGFGTQSMPLLPGSPCLLLVTPNSQVLSVVNGAPLDVSIQIPDNPVLAGMVVHQQVLAAGLLGGAIANVVSTNRLTVTLGSF